MEELTTKLGMVSVLEFIQLLIRILLGKVFITHCGHRGLLVSSVLHPWHRNTALRWSYHQDEGVEQWGDLVMLSWSIPCTTAGRQRQPEAHPLLSWLHVRHFPHSQINAQSQGWLYGGNTSGLCLFLWPYFLSHETNLCTVYFWWTSPLLRSRFSQSTPLSSQPGLSPDGAGRNNEEGKMIKPIQSRTKGLSINLNILFPTRRY